MSKVTKRMMKKESNVALSHKVAEVVESYDHQRSEGTRYINEDRKCSCLKQNHTVYILMPCESHTFFRELTKQKYK